jgi:sortase A
LWTNAGACEAAGGNIVTGSIKGGYTVKTGLLRLVLALVVTVAVVYLLQTPTAQVQSLPSKGKIYYSGLDPVVRATAESFQMASSSDHLLAMNPQEASPTPISPLPTPTPTPTFFFQPTPTPTFPFEPTPTPTPTPTPLLPTVLLPPTGANLAQQPLDAGPSDVGVSAIPVTAGPKAQAGPDRLELPAIGVDTGVIPVIWKQATNPDGQIQIQWQVAERAAGWHVDSVLPGQVGNVVISGHNNTGGAVFRLLHHLRKGDLATVWLDNRAYAYVVEEVMLLPETDADAEQRARNATWIAPFDDSRLTLVSCWPEDGNSHRVVVIARPVRD